MYEILSNLPESVAYTCINCTEQHPAEWRLALEKELQVSLRQVLTALLNSRTTSHLLRYRQVSWSLRPANALWREVLPGARLSSGVAVRRAATVSVSCLAQHGLGVLLYFFGSFTWKSSGYL